MPYIEAMKKPGPRIEIITIPNAFRDFDLQKDPQYVAHSNHQFALIEAYDRHVAKVLKTVPYFMRQVGGTAAIDRNVVDWVPTDLLVVFIERSDPYTKNSAYWASFRSHYQATSTPEYLVLPDGTLRGSWEALEELKLIDG